MLSVLPSSIKIISSRSPASLLTTASINIAKLCSSLKTGTIKDISGLATLDFDAGVCAALAITHAVVHFLFGARMAQWKNMDLPL